MGTRRYNKFLFSIILQTGAVEENESLGSRRLAAIMFTDIVGYTSLAQKNEKAAMDLLAEHERTLRPIFQNFHGRVVKTIGDAFLVEFASALEAVQCADSIQKEFRERNGRVAQDKKILLRVGVHVGEVIVNDDGDLLGDAVNVAARIEPLAEPGEVCISGQVHDYLQNKSDFSFVKLPNPSLKNVTSGVEVYRLVQGMAAASPPSLPKTRVAVLPFANISPDPNDEYFAEGMTEELIKTLAGVRELTVIARTSIMKYKNSTKSASEI